MHATDAAWLKRFPELEILIDSSSLQARVRELGSRLRATTARTRPCWWAC